MVRRIRAYSGRDPEMRQIVAELEGERAMWAAPMSAMELKVRHFASSSMARGRDEYGRAQRRK